MAENGDPPADGLLEMRAFFTVAAQLCDAVGDVHRQGRTHGRVNPEALVWRDGQLERRLLWTSEGAHRPYQAPEQTGRISRPVDYRSDLYSLGATMYALLTGVPPFVATDPLELVHAHIARTPASPAHRRPGMPAALSAIVLKLLAKEAEDRYQSIDGLRHDLNRACLSWMGGDDAVFALGEHDASDRLVIPQRLYGRARELETLLRAFETTCAGPSALLLVAGYSGVGKTTLVRELHRPIVRRRGYFVVGKVDQVVRSVPYGVLIQAFRGLVAQLLTESPERLAGWRDRLSAALGANGGVLAAVLPEIELVTGPQAAPPPLDPAESQNRFRYVFQNFVRTIARAEHPLVVVLDDLQWVDTATLDLLQALLTSDEIGHLLVVGAFRDNEVGFDHPLTRAVGRLTVSGGLVQRLALGPLALDSLVEFLSDVLRQSAPSVEPLAGLIQQKTDGNPFFVIQFLRMLEHEGYFAFDRETRSWTFRLDDIASAQTTDNVADLMSRKIQWLAPQAQQALTLAACVGNRFTLQTLITVSRQPPDEIQAGLDDACAAGLIDAVADGLAATRPDDADAGGTTYMFLHDQVQRAAYDRIPDDRKIPLHLDVGRLLLADYRERPSDERLFEVVNHLNVGRVLITSGAERRLLADLNLAAGRKAKTSAAYQAACDYLDAGIVVLDASHWETDYELMFALHVEAAECRYFAGAFEQAEAEFARLLPHAASARDRAVVHGLWGTLHENQSRWQAAVAQGRQGLALFGIVLPEESGAVQAALEREVAAVQERLGSRPIRSLLDLPLMVDPDMRTVMRSLTTLWAPAYISGNQGLARLISATMVRLSLEHGNTEDSAYGYVTHAITVGPVRGDYRAAFDWGELALAVNDRFGDAKRRAKIHQQFQAHVSPWCRPLEACLPHAREALRSGLETGDFTYAGYGAATEAWAAWLGARDIDVFVRDYAGHLELLARLKLEGFRDAHQVLLNWARALQGRTTGPTSLAYDEFDEQAFVDRYESSGPFFLTFLYAARLHLHLVHGEFGPALAAARRARAATVEGIIWPVLIDVWAAMASAALYAEAADADRRRYRQQIDATHAALEKLDAHSPENFRAWRLLVAGAAHRVAGRSADAARSAEEAAAFARQLRQPWAQALAHESAAAAWREAGEEGPAASALRHAHLVYREWGAQAKVAAMEREYAGVLAVGRPARAVSASARPPTGTDGFALDTATIMRVAHAVSREIELKSLLRRLVELAVENAGAERGVFLQAQDGALVVQAELDAGAGRVSVLQATPLEHAADLSQRIVRYVQRMRQPVVLTHPAADERFAGDAYLEDTPVKSVLCVPVEQQGKLAGVLYLENRLTAGAFGPERLEMMHLLTSQAAIALENARLYEGLRSEVARRTAAEQALRGAMGELEGLKNRLEAENVYLQEEIRTQHNFDEIVGNSPVLLDALRRVERVAPTESTVLILGETGSGKELIARAVHHRSRRSHRPLVKVNCGAIAPGLVESELFGHVKGAFTGALDKRIGRFELAHGGTIFLDEVGELPLEAQVKLLRVLQEQEFEPVGSSRTVRVDIRVIAATNRNLEQAVADGRFRADLLYRLNVFPIDVPPLRSRPSDVPLLVGFLVASLSRRLGKELHGFSTRSIEWMRTYHWPGNVRELQNVVERAAILAQGPVLDVEPSLLGVATVPVVVEARAAAADQTLDDVQRSHILAVLRSTGGVVEGADGAARRLGLHPNTLRSRLKKLGVHLSTVRPMPPPA